MVKPLDTEAIRRAAETRLVVTVEDGVVEGGVGEEVLAELARQDAKAPVLTLGIPDRYIDVYKRQTGIAPSAS